MFRFRLNDVLLNDQPIGWEDFTESITRDEQLHLFTLTYDADLTFVGDGYKILNDLFLNDYCGELELKIEQQCGSGYEVITTLLVKITDLDQNLERCTAQANVTDNSFYGMIYNSRDIPVLLSAEASKNGVEIGACPYTEIRMFEPELDAMDNDNVIYYPSNRRIYEQTDALAHVLKFVTDNRINSVQSDFLDQLVWQPDALFNPAFLDRMKFGFMSGQELRSPNGFAPRVTFSGIMKTLFTMHNLFAKIEGSVLRLEPYDYFFQENQMKLTNLRDLIRSTDTTRLYSKVVFGSPESEDERTISPTYPTPINWSMPFVPIIAHGKQEFPLTGVCQTDVSLDLVAEYIYDSNTIEKVLYDAANTPTSERPDQSKDGSVFYIQYTTWTNSTPDTACFSLMFLLPTTPKRGITFNPYLWHSEVITRHGIQSDLVMYEAVESDNFKATAEAPNAFVQDFASPMIFWPFSAMSSPTNLSLQAAYPTIGNDPPFAAVSLPKLAFWGGLLNNSATSCQVPESGCSVAPVNLQFNNDSTNGNFDPNNNWDTSGYYFEAPQTGIYGFELNALLNKVQDQVSYASNVNNYFDISTYVQQGDFNGNLTRQENILFPRFLWVKIYITIFDSSNNVISEQLTYGNATIQESYGYNLLTIPDGSLLSSVIPSWQSANNDQGVTSTIGFLKYRQAQYVGQNWDEDFLVNRQHFAYLEAGYRVRPRIEIITLTHPTPIQAAQRRVSYGIRPGSVFKSFFIRTGGGSFQPVDPKLYRSLLYNFDQPMTKDLWQQLKANSEMGVEIGIAETLLTDTHVSKITRTLSNGQTSFEMMANRNQPFI